jgi:hypothetical protein
VLLEHLFDELLSQDQRVKLVQGIGMKLVQELFEVLLSYSIQNEVYLSLHLLDVSQEQVFFK